MNFQKHTILAGIAAVAFGGAFLIPGRMEAQQEDMEVLTRGPVHEAFAGTVSYNPEPGILVTVQVPEPIEEMPPEQRLEGDNVAWIPGYWAWDEEQNDFLWISGIWRNLPPGRQWVPGYWSDVDGGYQWTSGYWEDAESTEVTYLPEPPRSVEAGPNIAAPSNEHSWIPGNWMWADTRYAWRPGYWSPVRENWIWVPGYYRWSPLGYVYVNGYWDYAVARRGVLFAPVHFRRNVYASPGFYYSPATVISLVAFSNHLFLRPNYCHYYFGDYYAPRYRDRGFFVSYSYNSGRRGYDPIYSHYRWQNRNVRNWESQRRDYYEYRRDHENARPPRTFAALNSMSKDQRKRGSDYAVAEPLATYASTRGSGQERFQAVSKNDRQRIASQTQDVRKYSRERRQLETRRDSAAAAQGTASGKPVVRTKVGRSPVVATVNERSDKSVAPPKRLERRTSAQPKATAKATPEENKVRPSRETTQTMPSGRTPQSSRPDKATRTERPGPAATQTGKSRQPLETQTQKVAPENKRQSVPAPAVQKSTQSTTKSVPRPSTQTTKPEMKRQSVPAPSREVAPAPKKSRPAPVQRVEPTPTRQVQPQRQQVQPQRQQAPQPSRKAAPVQPQRQQVQPQRQQVQPQRQQVQPQRQQVQPQRQQVQPQRQQAPQPSRKAAPVQPQRQQVQRTPQKQASQPQRAAPQQQRSRSATESSSASSDRTKRGKSD